MKKLVLIILCISISLINYSQTNIDKVKQIISSYVMDNNFIVTPIEWKHYKEYNEITEEYYFFSSMNEAMLHIEGLNKGNGYNRNIKETSADITITITGNGEKYNMVINKEDLKNNYIFDSLNLVITNLSLVITNLRITKANLQQTKDSLLQIKTGIINSISKLEENKKDKLISYGLLLINNKLALVKSFDGMTAHDRLSCNYRFWKGRNEYAEYQWQNNNITSHGFGREFRMSRRAYEEICWHSGKIELCNKFTKSYYKSLINDDKYFQDSLIKQKESRLNNTEVLNIDKQILTLNDKQILTLNEQLLFSDNQLGEINNKILLINKQTNSINIPDKRYFTIKKESKRYSIDFVYQACSNGGDLRYYVKTFILDYKLNILDIN